MLGIIKWDGAVLGTDDWLWGTANGGYESHLGRSGKAVWKR